MSQRKEEKDNPDSKLTLPAYGAFWRPLQKKQTIRKNLDEHLKMLQVIDTTDKQELRKMVKK